MIIHKDPRPLSRVKIVEGYRETLSGEQMSLVSNPEFYRGFLAEHHFIFMGEISNQTGHVMLFEVSGKLYHGFHIWDFE